jgi:hypothetical protein
LWRVIEALANISSRNCYSAKNAALCLKSLQFSPAIIEPLFDSRVALPKEARSFPAPEIKRLWGPSRG